MTTTSTDAQPAVDDPGTERRRHRLTRRWGLTAVAMATLAFAGWQRRWLCDDAFINYRVLAQIGAGNGPVYNAGERVEVGTSTLWLITVGLAHLVGQVRLEMISIVVSIVAAVAGLAFGVGGGRRLLTGSRDEEHDVWWLPLGALVFVATAAAWDWSTGGLENGLTWCWLGGAFLLTVSVANRPNETRLALGAAVTCGLGVLVRPDFAPYTLAWGGLVVAVLWRTTGPHRALLTGAIGLAAPIAFQVFRMGYYGQVLPNTVYAKEGGTAWWDQGWRYLENFAGAYWLVVPMVVLAAGGTAVLWHRRTDRRLLVLVAATEGAVLVHTALVVRAGGDYMHARLLMSPWFASLLPFFAVPLSPRTLRSGTPVGRLAAAAGALTLVGWMVVSAVHLRPPPGGLLDGIVDDRQLEIASSGVAHPIDLETRLHYLGLNKEQRGERARRPGWSADGLATETPLGPLRDGLPATAYVPTTAAGAFAYGMPTDVNVVDLLGLGNRLVARTRLDRRWVPGHEKHVEDVWWAAALLRSDAAFDPELNPVYPFMLAPGDEPGSTDPAEVARRREAATAALGCGDLRDLLATSEAQMTLGRFGRNLIDAVRLHGLRIPTDPVEAERQQCGG